MRRQTTHTTRVCQHCGAAFDIYVHRLKDGRGRYCSRACTYAARVGDASARFWKHVDTTGGPDGCWLWQGSQARRGYGRFEHRAVRHMAHRFSWELAHGPIPDNLWVLHRCDNPPCVNPAHLFLGTHQDNMADKVAKGRQSHGDYHRASLKTRTRGERHHSAQLTEQAVAEIRARYAAGDCYQWQLAQEYGVAQNTIWAVVTGKTWKHLHR